MMRRVWPSIGLVAALAVIVSVALASQAQPISTYSTFDTGINGFAALFNVLRVEGVPVERLQRPLGLLSSKVRVIAFTSTAPERSVGQALAYDASDYKRLARFEKGGGRLVYFSSGKSDPVLKQFKTYRLRVTVLQAAAFANAALAKNPRAIVRAYDALAGHGVVAFDERLHGYALDVTMWSVLPLPVRIAFWLVVLAVAIVLVEANVRFAPPIAQELPADRDSSAYIASMAALLRRAGARRAAIARFAKTAPHDDELQQLAAIGRPADRALLRAAYLVSRSRKERL